MVAKVINQFFMLVLTVLSEPADVKEFRADAVSPAGHIESLVVHRTESGFALQDPSAENKTEIGSIRPVADKPGGYVLKIGDEPEQTIDIAKVIQGFSVDVLQKEKTLVLKASDGEVIHLRRSGSSTYLTLEKGNVVYVSH